MLQITQRNEADRTVLTISGRLDIQARKPFQLEMQQAQSSNLPHLIANLSHVTFIDSSAIGVLILAHRALERTNTKLSLIVPPGIVLDTLQLMNTGTLIPIHKTEPPHANLLSNSKVRTHHALHSFV